MSVEWRIRDVLSMCRGRHDYFDSPEYRSGDERWRMRLYPSWRNEIGNPASGWLRLRVGRCDVALDKIFHVTVGIKGTGGSDLQREVERKFSILDNYEWEEFCSRSDLIEHKTRLMPDDTLTITCVIRSVVPGATTGVFSHPHPPIQADSAIGEPVDPANGSQSSNKRENKELRKEMKHQIKDCVKSYDGYLSEIRSYKSKIADLEKKLLLNEKNYKERIQTGFNESSKMRKENEVLRAKMKTLKHQIKDYVKRNHGYCSEISSYKIKITDLENKLLLNEKNYEDKLQTSLNESNESSKWKKEIEDIRAEMETLIQQVKDNVKSKAGYRSEISSYKIKVTDLESKLLLNEKNYKDQIQTSLNESSKLKKENEVLTAKMKTLIQQIKDYVKRNDEYCSEVISYKRKVTDLENELLLNEKNYEERIQRSLNESSKMKKDNDLLKKEVEVYVKQIKTLQKTVENYSESEKYKKQISALESEKLSIAEEHKCLLEEKLTRLEKKNEVLRAEMKTLIQQVKDYDKSNAGYRSEIRSYKSQVADLENKLLLTEKNYEEQIQASLNESSKMKKDNDLLKEEVEYFMQQIKTLQKTVENYELESGNYKKQISALESEQLSFAEEHDCALEEKLTIVSGLEKAAFDDKAEERNSEKHDEEDNEGYKSKKKKLSQVKNTKKISLPSRHGSVIRSLKAILVEGRRADFTLKSGSHEWPVHRAILEGRSGHFETLFRGDWTKKDEVRFDDVAEGTLEGILHFIYAGEVGNMSVENVCGIYVAAHKLLLQDLKSLCVEYMKGKMYPEMVCGALAIAETYGEGDLKECALECFFRESNRIVATEGWKELKENHPAIIGELFREFIKRERKNRRKEED